MDTSALLNQILKTGRDLATKGQDLAEKKLDVPESGPTRDAMLSGMGKGAVAAGLLAILLGTKGGRRLTGSAIKLGSLAAIGGLAYKAYHDWQAKQKVVGGADQPIDQLTGPSAEKRGRVLLGALIAAAKADGHIDDKEQATIDSQIRTLNLDTETLHFIKEQVGRPLDAREIAAGADSPETAAEIYLTSLAIIDVADEKERAYLSELATHLKLAPDFVAELEKQVKA